MQTKMYITTRHAKLNNVCENVIKYHIILFPHEKLLGPLQYFII